MIRCIAFPKEVEGCTAPFAEGKGVPAPELLAFGEAFQVREAATRIKRSKSNTRGLKRSEKGEVGAFGTSSGFSVNWWRIASSCIASSANRADSEELSMRGGLFAPDRGAA
jgi:hypothetical protein